MKQVYFVTEGVTDQIILEGLIEYWMAGEDFLSSRIQPPSSAYADTTESPLSQGWRGVMTWCGSPRPDICRSREEVLRRADILVIHVDADVARDKSFSNPAYTLVIPPVSPMCDHVHSVLSGMFGGSVPNKVVFCVPSLDLEAWVLASLYPGLADMNMPIECLEVPASLLVSRNPYRLVRSKGGTLKKLPDRYKLALSKFVSGWADCLVRAPEAAKFEAKVKALL